MSGSLGIESSLDGDKIGFYLGPNRVHIHNHGLERIMIREEVLLAISKYFLKKRKECEANIPNARSLYYFITWPMNGQYMWWNKLAWLHLSKLTFISDYQGDDDIDSVSFWDSLKLIKLTNKSFNVSPLLFDLKGYQRHPCFIGSHHLHSTEKNITHKRIPLNRHKFWFVFFETSPLCRTAVTEAALEFFCTITRLSFYEKHSYKKHRPISAKTLENI